VGAVETLRREPGGVAVRGWALDPDLAGSVTVEVLSDGAVVTGLAATRERTGLPVAYAPTGTAHGFSAVLDLPVGTHAVCARAVNADATDGTTKQLGCRTVTVSHTPSAVLSALRTVPGGAVVAAGDAYDPDTLSATTVNVLVDGRVFRTTSAGRTSTTAATRWPGYGAAHAFTSSMSIAAGRHTVCVRAENALGTPGTPVTLPCRVLVVHDATGTVASVARSGRTVTLRGWALDPDTRTAARASLYVDGRLVSTVVANGYRSDVARAVPGYGSYHGYRLVRTLTRGTHRLCVVSRNVPGTLGSTRTVACRTVTVP
jgi:hypothetical protein